MNDGKARANAADAARPLIASASRGLSGIVTAPGDKSISHRALMLGLLAAGETKITGLLEGADVLATARVMGQLGAAVARDGDGTWRIHGRGIGALREPADILDFENSGTSCRLTLGMLATHPISAHLTGDASLRSRPMERVLKPLGEIGALAHSRGGKLPIFIEGTGTGLPIVYEMPVASAQVKSAILLAALNVAGETTVIEKAPTRDHTERMLKHFGADVRIEMINGRRHIRLIGQPELRARSVEVPGDPSSAAFLIVSALITPDSSITVRNVLMNEGRTGLFATLLEMGANIRVRNERDSGGERIADLEASTSTLKGVDVPAGRAPSMIDEYPILAVAAACAEGTTRMAGLEELRVKESDRLAAIAKGLRACGIGATEGEASLSVEGRGAQGVAGGGSVQTHMDHRIAMAFLTLGLAARDPVRVDDGRMIATSFPGYFDLMTSLGAGIRIANR
jgi:3-phosphoshikimate 1-carboxyvinyltransferase